MSQSIKKVFVAAVLIGVFLIYSLIHARDSAAPITSSTGSNGSNGSNVPSVSGPSGSTGGTTTGGTTTYKDGSYTGSPADAQWGTIQVKAVISGGRITNVQFLQYPNERSRSVEINSYADPQLTQEAIQAQSAQVDIISGATDTSEAFMQSLSSALSQAQG